MDAAMSAKTHVVHALDAFRDVLDAAGVIEGGAPDAARYLHDCTGDYQGTALAVLRPRSVEDVQTIVRICADRRISIIPQGGNTGLVSGTIGSDAEHAVVVSL